MKKLLSVIIFFLFSSGALGYPRFLTINIAPVSCQNHAYEIVIRLTLDAESDIIFTGMEIMYGDGTRESSVPNENDLVFKNSYQKYYEVRKKHTYPGPGVYIVSARDFNRTSDIANMDNSINTPLYTETKFIADSYLGCNHTPQIENIPFPMSLGSQTFYNDYSFIDKEGDSLSFHFTTPLQDKNIPVINYWLPLEEQELKPISKVAIDPINGSIFWNNNHVEETYTFAIIIKEWRKVDGEDYLISSTAMDWNVDFFETTNQQPRYSSMQDTAIIVGHNLTLSITASDPENDSLLFNCYGDFFQLPENEHSEQFDYTLGPIQKNIDFTPTIEQVRNKPYKAIFSATNKPFNKTESSYIWVADKAHSPEPVTLFTGEEISEGVILLSWVDTEDELGYIIERADKYFPKFNRLVVLPANISTFTDPSVVNGNTYWYRIKAVGTKMSDYSTTMMSTSDIITSLPASTINSRLKIFPNPSNGTFQVLIGTSLDGIEICDISGKTVWKKDVLALPELLKSIKISSGLSSGIYIINAYSNNDITSQKILIR